MLLLFFQFGPENAVVQNHVWSCRLDLAENSTYLLFLLISTLVTVTSPGCACKEEQKQQNQKDPIHDGSTRRWLEKEPPPCRQLDLPCRGQLQAQSKREEHRQQSASCASECRHRWSKGRTSGNATSATSIAAAADPAVAAFS